MKAIILAAGFGTRLKPYTDHTPKALFPYRGRPLLDRMIRDLQQAGCRAILVNTHHMAHRISRFIADQHYAIPVTTRFEPKILGTGGAMINAADFLDDRPFMVVNSDIITDIDLSAVYRYHVAHRHPATLVLTDHPAYNTVQVDPDLRILGFHGRDAAAGDSGHRRLTFTGIQVLDRSCLAFIPQRTFSSSIHAYEKMIARGRRIGAYVADGCQWIDMGTPERYQRAVGDQMAAETFDRMAAPGARREPVDRTRLKGDGSDRRWYRLRAGDRSVILADHGIRKTLDTCEVDACVAIGRHLHRQGVPVPEIMGYDVFSGLVFMQDLGDVHLQEVVRSAGTRETVITVYRRVIDAMVNMSRLGAEGFDPAWTFQTARYSKDFILAYECRYFVESFLNGYMGIQKDFEDFSAAFDALSDGAVANGIDGFMHRDFQSRNIMVNGHRCYFIDFQGGRLGPVQYDLASLLLDPYVALPPDIRQALRDYAMDRIAASRAVDRDRFTAGFRCCALARNLQILGAFGFLSRVKGKTGFERYIPAALKSLAELLDEFDTGEFVPLKETVGALRPENMPPSTGGKGFRAETRRRRV